MRTMYPLPPTVELGKQIVMTNPSTQQGDTLTGQDAMLQRKLARTNAIMALVQSLPTQYFYPETTAFDRVQLHWAHPKDWNEALFDLVQVLGIDAEVPAFNLDDYPGFFGFRFAMTRGYLRCRVSLLPPGFQWNSGYEVVFDDFVVGADAIRQGHKAAEEPDDLPLRGRSEVEAPQEEDEYVEDEGAEEEGQEDEYVEDEEGAEEEGLGDELNLDDL